MSLPRYAEKAYPYALSLVAGFACWWFEVELTQQKLESLLTSAISVSAIFLGFLGTSKAMLLSFRSARYSWLKNNATMWRLLLGYLKSAFNCSFLACIVLLVFLVLDISELPEQSKQFVTPLLVSVYGLSIVTFYRVVSAFFSILSSESN